MLKVRSLLKGILLCTTALALVSVPAQAQVIGTVRQLGQATPGDCSTFVANGTIADSGSICGHGGSGGGGVVGPTISTNGDLSTFTGTTGQTIGDSGFGVPVPVGKGGTGQITAQGARSASALNIDQITLLGDANATLTSIMREVGTSTILGTTRIWTLSASSSMNAGQELLIVDLAGGVTPANQILVQANGADSINGSFQATINQAHAGLLLTSDGAGHWASEAIGLNAGLYTVVGGGGITVSGLNTVTNNMTLVAGANTTVTGSAATAYTISAAGGSVGGGVQTIVGGANISISGSGSNASETVSVPPTISVSQVSITGGSIAGSIISGATSTGKLQGVIIGTGIQYSSGTLTNTGVLQVQGSLPIGFSSSGGTYTGSINSANLGPQLTLSGGTLSGNYVAGAGISIVANTISGTISGISSIVAGNNLNSVTNNNTILGNLQAGTNLQLSGGNTIALAPTIGGFTLTNYNSIPVTYTGTLHTIVPSDCGQVLNMSNSGSITLAFPATMTACNLAVVQGSQGTVYPTTLAGATINNSHNFTRTFGKNAVVSFIETSNTGGTLATWAMAGDGAPLSIASLGANTLVASTAMQDSALSSALIYANSTGLFGPATIGTGLSISAAGSLSNTGVLTAQPGAGITINGSTSGSFSGAITISSGGGISSVVAGNSLVSISNNNTIFGSLAGSNGVTLTNTNTIGATLAAGAGIGIATTANVPTITNNGLTKIYTNNAGTVGTITNGGTIVGHAIVPGAGITINGSTSGTFASSTTPFTISAAGGSGISSVVAGNSLVSISNNNTIFGSLAGSNGVTIASTNTIGATLSAGAGIGISISSNVPTITNNGLTKIYTNNAGTVGTVTNGGTIAGYALVPGAGITINGSTSGTFTNSSTPYTLSAAGGGGTPGGSVSSFQYNNSGTFGGVGPIASAVPAWNGSTITTTVPYGTASAASSILLRDTNQNGTINNLFEGATLTTANGGTNTLTAASGRYQDLTGSTIQTYQLPDATTLPLGPTFVFNNNSSSSLSIVNSAAASVYTVPAGGISQIGPTSNGTATGTWDVHSYIPSNATWGTGTTGLQMNNVLTTTPQVSSGAASCTVPVFIPQRGSATTGLGGDGTHDCIIVGGAQIVSVASTGESITGTVNASAGLYANGVAAMTNVRTNSAGTVGTVTNGGTIVGYALVPGAGITINGSTSGTFANSATPYTLSAAGGGGGLSSIVSGNTAYATISNSNTITVLTGVSGNTLIAANGNNTFSGSNSFTGNVNFATITGYYGKVVDNTNTSDTVTGAYCGVLQRYTSNTFVSVTMPGTLTPGCSVGMEQYGTGQLTILAGSGATVHSAYGATISYGQYAIIGAVADTASGGTVTTWDLTGALTSVSGLASITATGGFLVASTAASIATIKGSIIAGAGITFNTVSNVGTIVNAGLTGAVPGSGITINGSTSGTFTGLITLSSAGGGGSSGTIQIGGSNVSINGTLSTIAGPFTNLGGDTVTGSFQAGIGGSSYGTIIQCYGGASGGCGTQIGLGSPPVSIASAATITMDGSKGPNFDMTISGSVTASITRFVPGECGLIHVQSGASTIGTLGYAANIHFPLKTAPTLTGTVNAQDMLSYCVDPNTIMALQMAIPNY